MLSLTSRFIKEEKTMRMDPVCFRGSRRRMLRPPLLSVTTILAAVAGCSGEARPPSSASIVQSPLQPERDPARVPTPDPAACGAARARFAVGQPFTPELLRRAEVAAGPAATRVLRWGETHTLEHSDRRLTLKLDQKGAVASVWCG